MKYIDRLFKAPAGVAPLGGMTATEREAAFMRDAGPPPPRPAPVPATKQLRTNLERVTMAYNDRERVLVKEIAEREAELADVRRARDATTAALMELEVDLPELDVDAAQVAAMSEQERDAAVVAKYGPVEFVGEYPSPVRAASRGGFSIEQIEISSGMGLDHIGHFYSVYRTRSPLQEGDASYRPRVLAAKEVYDGQ